MINISPNTYDYIVEQISERIERNNNNYQFLCSFEKRKNNYRELLKRVGLITNEHAASIFSLKKGTRNNISLSAKKGISLYTSSNNYYSSFEDFGLEAFSKIENSIVNNYVIYLNKREDIFVDSVFEKSYRASSLSANSIQEDLSFINLPLFFYNLINEPSFAESKMVFENLLKKNQESTFFNVYNYVKNHMEEISKIPEIIEKLITLVKDNAKIFYLESFNFVRTPENYGKFEVYFENKAIPYNIYFSSEKSIKIKMNLNLIKNNLKIMLNDNEFDELIKGIVNFPSIITFSEGKIEIGYISRTNLKEIFALRNLVISPFSNNTKFLSFEKASNLLFEEEKIDGKRWKKIVDKVIVFHKLFLLRKQKVLENNVQLVISKLSENFAGTSSYNNRLEEGERHLEEIKNNCETIDRNFNELVATLLRIYKNEILMTSL